MNSHAGAAPFGPAGPAGPTAHDQAVADAITRTRLRITPDFYIDQFSGTGHQFADIVEDGDPRRDATGVVHRPFRRRPRSRKPSTGELPADPEFALLDVRHNRPGSQDEEGLLVIEDPRSTHETSSAPSRYDLLAAELVIGCVDGDTSMQMVEARPQSIVRYVHVTQHAALVVIPTADPATVPGLRELNDALLARRRALRTDEPIDRSPVGILIGELMSYLGEHTRHGHLDIVGTWYPEEPDGGGTAGLWAPRLGSGSGLLALSDSKLSALGWHDELTVYGPRPGEITIG